MTDDRLLHGSATDFEKTLLQAAIEEAPTKELSAQMMAPLALGAAATGATTSAAAKASSVKWLGAGAGALIVGGAVFLGTTGGEDEAPASSAQNAAPIVARAVPRPSNEAPADAEAKQAPQAPAQAEEPNVVQEPAPIPPRASSKKPSSTLAAEMRLLDQARTALKTRKDAKEALRILSIYDKKYPSGALRPEATVLRVSALEESGAESRASELKSEFLKAHPKSAHKKQLEGKSGEAK